MLQLVDQQLLLATEGEADNDFTIVGKDVFGNTITEVMNGAAGKIAAKSKNVFDSTASMAPQSTGQNITIGNFSDALTTGVDTDLVAADSTRKTFQAANAQVVASAAIGTTTRLLL